MLISGSAVVGDILRGGISSTIVLGANYGGCDRGYIVFSILAIFRTSCITGLPILIPDGSDVE